jgi:predicted nucleotide-binding protein (sugar kinase/HSP70/actin superfamily)
MIDTHAPAGERHDGSARRHFKRPAERAFTARERARVTLLFGGLTVRHDQLMAAGIEGLGYRAQAILPPTKADFQAGREYGNNGQCNPTYFTVGALVNFLKHLRDEQGLPVERILADYVFVTVGSCGPCRFGMYEAEYRLALRNSGFDGFRVLVFSQEAGLSQSEAAEVGLALNPLFFATLINAVMVGDLLTELTHQLRPYEVEAGATDRILARCLAICQEALRQGEDANRAGMMWRGLAKLLSLDDADSYADLLAQYRGQRLCAALERCRALIEAGFAVDYTRPRPVAKITGEFWAQTTEGDGNFHMFRFLEGEGAEVLVEPVATWIDYTLYHARQWMRDRQGLAAGDMPWRGGLRQAWRYRKNLLLLTLASKLFRRAYERRRLALGGTAHALASQFELQRVGHPYYNSRCGGGEGHLEVAKNIYYSHRNLAHLVLSLKPFGCMPSTQSDGAQAAVLAHYPDMSFLPVETSGEGDINAYSRVQMALGEAQAKCRQEFGQALARSGWRLEDIRAFVARHPDLQRPLLQIPHPPGVTGLAARFILYVAGQMDRDQTWAGRKSAVPAEGAT